MECLYERKKIVKETIILKFLRSKKMKKISKLFPFILLFLNLLSYRYVGTNIMPLFLADIFVTVVFILNVLFLCSIIYKNITLIILNWIIY